MDIREVEIMLDGRRLGRRVRFVLAAGERVWRSDAVVAVRRGGGRTVYPTAIHLTGPEVMAGQVVLRLSHLTEFRDLVPSMAGWVDRPDIGWRGDVPPTADRANWDPDAVQAASLASVRPPVFVETFDDSLVERRTYLGLGLECRYDPSDGSSLLDLRGDRLGIIVVSPSVRYGFADRRDSVPAIKHILASPAHVALPLYAYSHGGVTISTSPFGDPWDSGQIGAIYAERAAVLAEFAVPRITAEIRARATRTLNAEVAELDDILNSSFEVA